MAQTRKLLFILFGLLIICLIFMAAQEGKSNSSAEGCTGFIILIYLGLILITYKYAKDTNRNAMLYVIGTLIMPYLIPLILALLSPKSPKAPTEQYSRPPSGIHRTPAGTTQAQRLPEDQPGTSASADKTEIPIRASGNVVVSSSVPQSEQSILDSQFSILKMSNNYRLALKGLKFGAICIILFGLFTTLSAFSLSGIALLFALVAGLLLIAEGSFILKRQSVQWLLFTGLSFIILAITMILLSANDLASGVGSQESLAYSFQFSVILIFFGCINIMRYRRFSSVPTMKPTDAINTTIINLVYGVTRVDIKQEPELIEFRTVEFLGRKLWKARLAGNSGIFVTSNEKDVVMEKKSSIQFIPEGESLPNKMIKVTIRIGQKSYNGTIDNENFSKYRNWKK